MNKKITLYELLGLAKEGKAPKKVKLCEETFIFVDGRYYEEHHINDDNGRMGDYFALDGMLNDEVEILDDEDKEKNKIPTEEEMETFGYNVAKIFKAYEKGVRMALEENNDIEELTYESTFEDNSDMEVQEVLLSKINELVREINKLKKDK